MQTRLQNEATQNEREWIAANRLVFRKKDQVDLNGDGDEEQFFLQDDRFFYRIGPHLRGIRNAPDSANGVATKREFSFETTAHQ